MADDIPPQLTDSIDSDDALVPNNIGHINDSHRLNTEVLTRRVHDMMTHSDNHRGIFGICNVPDVLLWDMATNASGVRLSRGPQRLYHPNLSQPVTFWLPGVLKDVNLRDPDDDDLPTICVSTALFGKDSAGEARALLGNNGAHPVHTCRGTPLIGAWRHQRLQAVGDSGYERERFDNFWDGTSVLTAKANMQRWCEGIKPNDIVLLEVEAIRYRNGGRAIWGPASFDLKHVVLLYSGCGHRSCDGLHRLADTLPVTL